MRYSLCMKKVIWFVFLFFAMQVNAQSNVQKVTAASLDISSPVSGAVSSENQLVLAWTKGGGGAHFIECSYCENNNWSQPHRLIEIKTDFPKLDLLPHAHGIWFAYRNNNSIEIADLVDNGQLQTLFAIEEKGIVDFELYSLSGYPVLIYTKEINRRKTLFLERGYETHQISSVSLDFSKFEIVHEEDGIRVLYVEDGHLMSFMIDSRGNSSRHKVSPTGGVIDFCVSRDTKQTAALFSTSKGDKQALYLSFCRENWTQPEEIAEITGEKIICMNIEKGTEDHWLAVWQQENLLYGRYLEDETWHASFCLKINLEQSCLKAIRDGGFRLYGYQKNENVLACLHTHPETGWNKRDILSKGIVIEGLALEKDKRGERALIWCERERFRSTIKSMFISDLDSPKKVSLQEKEEVFPTETVKVLVLNWEPSSDDDVTRYNIYSNGKKIGSVESSQCYFRTISSGKGQHVFFSITAVTENGRESVATTINYSS